MSHQNRTFVQQTQISGTLGEITSIPANLATYQTDHRTLADDLKAIRFQVDSIIGETTWLDAPSQDLATIYAGLHVSGSDVAVQGNLDVLSGDVSALSGSFTSGLTVGGDGINVTEGGLTIAGDTLEVNGTMSVTGVSDLANVFTSSDVNVSGSLVVSSSADFNGGVTANSIKVDGDVANRLYIVDADGSLKDEANLNFSGTQLGVTGSLTVSSNIKIDNDVAQRLYIVDADGSIKDEANLTFDGSKLIVTGSIEATGDLIVDNFAINGDVANRLYIVDTDGTIKDEANLNFNGTQLDVTGSLTVSDDIYVDGDVAQRLYIVGSSGELKDEANLNFNGTQLGVTGSLTVSDDIYVDGDVANRLYVVGSSGELKDEANLNFSGTQLDVTGSLAVTDDIFIDGDTANRLYIVGSSGELKDESKLTFDGSLLTVDGDATFTGDVTVDGDLRVKGTMTYIDTANMRVMDAFIYLATGSAGTTDSGIVLHGGAGSNMDLVIGQDSGSGEVIFGKADRSPDGEGAMDGIALVPAWMSELKLGDAEGSLSGSLSISGNDLSLTASSDLVFVDQTDSMKLGTAADWALFNDSPVSGSTSIMGALAALASGDTISKKAVITGTFAADSNIAVSVNSMTFRSTCDMSKDLDVYFNGILLKGSEDGTDADYYRGSGSGNVKLKFEMDSSDVLTVVFRNPE